MAKRFTDTAKWGKAWFQDLSLDARWTWIYLVDNCDNTGVWSANFRLMSFQIGFNVTEPLLVSWLGNKIIKFDSNKFFIPSFIEFQYGELKETNNAHRPVIKFLEQFQLHLAPSVDLTRTLLGPQDKEQDKDKDSSSFSFLKTGEEVLEIQTKKNLPKRNSKAIRKNIEQSPLAFLFEATDEIQVWLCTGTESVQREILSRYGHLAIASEIKKAYFWQCEKQSRQAGSFLLNWLSDSKALAKGPNILKVQVSASNPTGNPHLAKAEALRRQIEAGESA